MGEKTHSLWLVGFRPLFLLAIVAGVVMPMAWAAIHSGWIVAPQLAPSAQAWHAHEMFYGFGWAALGGFLLTASKNWVGIRGYSGWPLELLALAWIVERVVLACPGGKPPELVLLASFIFLPLAVGMLVATLIRHRHADSYPDNLYFIFALPLFLPAKLLLLTADSSAAGIAMTLGLFRLAFLIMLERTLTQFMKGALQIAISRRPWLDHAIKSLAFLAVFAPWLPEAGAALLELLLAALLALRWLAWRPFAALRRLEIGVMYLGYAAIVIQLVLGAVGRLAAAPWVGSLPLHVFSFGAMGLILPAMMIRIAKGHTGRKVTFDAVDRTVLWIMLLALALRVVATQWLPAFYAKWVVAAAACWFLCFGLLGWRYIPYLLAPRVDGKEH